MPRRPRQDAEDGVHHVFARGAARQKIFLADRDRHGYLELLGEAVGRYDWSCLAYCLMDNHLHLLLEVPGGTLGKGMQWLHGRYAEGFNERHDRSGHVFQGRYGAERIRNEAHLWIAARYIARNPVEAGMAATAEAWRWSSHPAVVGDAATPAWLAVGRLLEHFSSAGGDPLQRYAALVAMAGVEEVRGG
jgi:putative transposase